MSTTKPNLKDQCRWTGEGYYTLDLGHGIAARLFLSEKLWAETDEALYQQLQSIAPIPGILDVILTPDAHVGGMVPVGCGIACFQ